ncbi:hypothetical protein [Pyrodictium occultum]|uniref:hypothetical protein n=1 Tax=Pyrodictium occultum TaxID=2309 RepID=UPI0009FA2E8A|nr:hypothetical protein [Pyrodictium occultum]
MAPTSGQEGREELRSLLESIAAVLDRVRKLAAYTAGLQKPDESSLGKEVARFYRELVENGVPPDQAEKLASQYLHSRLEQARTPAFSRLLEALSTATSEALSLLVALPPKAAGAATKSVLRFISFQLEELERLVKALPAPREEKEKVLREIEDVRRRAAGGSGGGGGPAGI